MRTSKRDRPFCNGRKAKGKGYCKTTIHTITINVKSVMNYKNLKTDKERLKAMSEVPYTDWHIISDWAKEAENEENKKRFLDYAKMLYHEEEASIGEL